MDISKLTIQGFKSFYEKSTFTFSSKITGVVGPNGSGKSNITEAIRFVLGEQSTKSMRGKDITDLLFRGNNVASSKASVEIEFKKSGDILNTTTENVFVKNALEKEIITISRIIYLDGKSEYKMNGVEIRVKDLHEFLIYIHIGNKSNWHISQGEADRVLLANNQDRRTLIEDALGLKIYHARINESIKKLDKTKENIKDAGYKRKEILPELANLSRLVEKIHKSSEWRLELGQKSSEYLSFKKLEIEKISESKKSVDNDKNIDHEIKLIESKILEKEKELNKNNKSDIEVFMRELEKEQRLLEMVLKEKKDLEVKIQDLENRKSYNLIEKDKNVKELAQINNELTQIIHSGNDIVFPEHLIFDFGKKLDSNVGKILEEEINTEYKNIVTKGSIVNKDNVKQVTYLQTIKGRLEVKLKDSAIEYQDLETKLSQVVPVLEHTNLKEKLVHERVDELQKQVLEFKYIKVEAEKDIQKLQFERIEMNSKLQKSHDLEQKIENLEISFIKEKNEFIQILGDINFENTISSIEYNDEEISNLKRSIERLKIRLEESTVNNREEIEHNYKNLSDQDEFLLKEIKDLESSVENLNTLISDLRMSLKNEFDIGLTNINEIFDSYVKRLFGGGSGKLKVVEIDNKNSDDNDEKEENKIGVEVEVEIPKKKIKGLQSLSGGERALVSIALNFSIVSQNPSPFMILDETDAALDEANSKRYGEILEMLKEKTKLIVVTHNRETMHFADQIYGVTLHKDGHSKILSVSFEEASEFAK